MKVSVITLSFNQAPFLERALRSVLAQDVPVEYLVVDPGSTDGSREIIERYRDRLAGVIYGADDGPADGLNKALARATGDVFACVNADDAMLPGAVSGAVRAFERRPDAAAVYASGYFIDSGGRVIRRFRSTQFDLRRFAAGGVNVMHQSTFVRRDACHSVGGFNPTNRTCWDGELLVDLGRAGYKLMRVRGLWGAFTLHPASISGSGLLEDVYERDRLRVFEKAVGRSPRSADWLWFVRARLTKLLIDPTYVAWRLEDAVRAPRFLEISS